MSEIDWKARAEAAEERAVVAEAGLSVLGGQWCAEIRAAGRNPCGACAWCCVQARKRAEAAERAARVEPALRDELLWIVSYLAHQDQDANHAWMVRRIRAVLVGKDPTQAGGWMESDGVRAPRHDERERLLARLQKVEVQLGHAQYAMKLLSIELHDVREMDPQTAELTDRLTKILEEP